MMYKPQPVDTDDVILSEDLLALTEQIISMEQSDYATALEYVKEACYIWKKLLQSTTDEQVNAYLTEAQRLIMFLERKIK